MIGLKEKKTRKSNEKNKGTGQGSRTEVGSKDAMKERRKEEGRK